MQMDWLPGPQLAELHRGEWAYLFLRHPGQKGAPLGGGGGRGEVSWRLAPHLFLQKNGCFFAI